MKFDNEGVAKSVRIHHEQFLAVFTSLLSILHVRDAIFTEDKVTNDKEETAKCSIHYLFLLCFKR